MADQKAGLRQAAAIAWADLATEVGLDAGAYRMQFLSLRKERASGGRIAALLTSESACHVLKMRVGREPDLFGRTVRAHLMAADAMRGTKGLNAPEVLAVNARHNALLISHCKGQTIWDMLAETNRKQDHEAALSAVGRWMSTFHKAQARDPVPFLPDGPLNALRRLARDKTYPDPARFDEVLGQLGDLGQGMLGKPVPQAVIHGDLTLSNLLINGDDVTGIDFENDASGPIARDLAMALVDYSVWFGQRDQLAAGPVLSPAIHRAFWAGYGEALQDDGVLAFHMGARLLRMWTAVPSDPAQRTVRRAHVWNGVSSVAASVLDIGK